MGFLILLLILGLVGGSIFGWGGWYISGNHIFEESGCFSGIVGFAIILIIIHLCFGSMVAIIAFFILLGVVLGLF